MRITAFWKWDTAPASPTNLAVRPKNVLAPVPVTNATISPCFATEPE